MHCTAVVSCRGATRVIQASIRPIYGYINRRHLLKCVQVIILMLKFKFLLWALAQILKKSAKNNPACAEYIDGKDIVFQIQTASGSGRNYTVKDGKVKSSGGLTKEPTFTLSFKDAAAGMSILTAKDKNAFMAGIQNKDLLISGDFGEVMWFQGLTKFLKPKKKK